MKLRAALFLFLLCHSLVASAQWTGFAGYADGAHDGAELAFGYRYETSSGTSISLHALQGVIYSTGAPDGFRKETFSNGQTVCRDLSNGQFSEKENCQSGFGFEYTPSAEVAQRITSSFSIGAGYRAGDAVGAYGAIHIQAFKVAHIVARVGPEYVGAAFGIHF